MIDRVTNIEIKMRNKETKRIALFTKYHHLICIKDGNYYEGQYEDGIKERVTCNIKSMYNYWESINEQNVTRSN